MVSTYSRFFFDFSHSGCTNIFSLEKIKFNTLVRLEVHYIFEKQNQNLLECTHTSSTTPVGNFHTPVPRNSPLFSWTTSTCHWMFTNPKTSAIIAESKKTTNVVKSPKHCRYMEPFWNWSSQKQNKMDVK